MFIYFVLAEEGKNPHEKGWILPMIRRVKSAVAAFPGVGFCCIGVDETVLDPVGGGVPSGYVCIIKMCKLIEGIRYRDDKSVASEAVTSICEDAFPERLDPKLK